MKKKTLSKTMHWLKDAGLKALVVLLLVTAGFYTYAQITWPAADPNDVSGIVGKFVGESSGVFDVTTTDYEGANALCSGSAVAGAHVCTPDEMINSYNHGVPGVSPVYTYTDSTTLWINNGPPAFTANANDCKGWVETTSPLENPNYGTIWNFSTKAGGLLPCRTGKAYACCK